MLPRKVSDDVLQRAADFPFRMFPQTLWLRSSLGSGKGLKCPYLETFPTCPTNRRISLLIRCIPLQSFRFAKLQVSRSEAQAWRRTKRRLDGPHEAMRGCRSLQP